MPARERPIDRGRARAHAAVLDVGREIREARRHHGLDQATVARAAHISRSQLSRIERGLVAGLSFDVAARLLSAVGMELSARAYPAGEPVRDAAHLALLGRLRGRLHRTLVWRAEVGINVTRDQRAWDAVVSGDGWRIAVEAETRPRDLQRLLRRLALKQRDDGMAVVILLLAATRHNAALIAVYRGELNAMFPCDGRRALELLAAGVTPDASAVILL
jgi:transcriptional regulator with XRE-family HTH domain